MQLRLCPTMREREKEKERHTYRFRYMTNSTYLTLAYPQPAYYCHLYCHSSNLSSSPSASHHITSHHITSHEACNCDSPPRKEWERREKDIQICSATWPTLPYLTLAYLQPTDYCRLNCHLSISSSASSASHYVTSNHIASYHII